MGTALLYTALSLLIPAKETFIERAVRPDEIFAQQVVVSLNSGSGSGLEEGHNAEKDGFRQRVEQKVERFL